MIDDWVETTLGAVADICGGGTPSTSESTYWGGDIVWLTPTEVVKRDGARIGTSERTLTEAGLLHSSAKLLPANAVLLTSRASVGFVALADRPLATNQGFQSLIARDGISPEFLMLWIQGNREEFKSRAGGSTFPEISKSNIAGIPISVPLPHIQLRIVDLMAHMDDHFMNLRLELQKCSASKENYLHFAFNENQGGAVYSLGELLRLDYGKAMKSADRRPGTVNVFGSAGPTGQHDLPLIKRPGVIVGRKGVNARGNLGAPLRRDMPLMSMGYSGWGGAGSVRWAERDHWVIDTAYSVVSLGSLSMQELYWVLVFADLPRFATTTTLPGLSRDTAYSVRVFVPDELPSHVKVLEAFDSVQQTLAVEVWNFDRLRARLLSSLMSMEIRVSDAYDLFMSEVA